MEKVLKHKMGADALFEKKSNISFWINYKKQGLGYGLISFKVSDYFYFQL